MSRMRSNDDAILVPDKSRHDLSRVWPRRRRACRACLACLSIAAHAQYSRLTEQKVLEVISISYAGACALVYDCTLLSTHHMHASESSVIMPRDLGELGVMYSREELR